MLPFLCRVKRRVSLAQFSYQVFFFWVFLLSLLLFTAFPKFILRSVERGMESVLKRFIMVVILLGIVGLFVTLFYTSVAFWVVFTVLSFLTYLAATV